MTVIPLLLRLSFLCSVVSPHHAPHWQTENLRNLSIRRKDEWLTCTLQWLSGWRWRTQWDGNWVARKFFRGTCVAVLLLPSFFADQFLLSTSRARMIDHLLEIHVTIPMWKSGMMTLMQRHHAADVATAVHLRARPIQRCGFVSWSF